MNAVTNSQFAGKENAKAFIDLPHDHAVEQYISNAADRVSANADHFKVEATANTSVTAVRKAANCGEGGDFAALLTKPSADKRANAAEAKRAIGPDDVMTPKPAENAVVRALKEAGFYKTPLGSGQHAVSCPWAQQHSSVGSETATYSEADEVHPFGEFLCRDPHGQKFRAKDLIYLLGVPNADARDRPLIRVISGELHRVADAAEEALAATGHYYQCGGLVVVISTNSVTGDPSVVSTNQQALTRALSAAATWEKWDGRSKEWICCDPPPRPVSILYDGQTFRHLKELAGVARQPFFRETDGELVTQPGYDEASQRFGVFDPGQFPTPGNTVEAARAALAMLLDLLCEFRFLSPADQAAALSAMFTAVVRQSLALAPAYHVRAPTMSSGKSYLCEVISAFAGPGESLKVSYPTSSEEATKMVLSLLLANPAVIEFDDMDSDWNPHGTIKRMLTSDRIADRILGASKVATVSTRTLFLGSGNNVGPARDLLRRVVTINLDQRCATPATRAYTGSPAEAVRQRRGEYVSAVLTIIQAWRHAGSPRADVSNIASYGGPWSDYCRHPLIWMGLPDPATALFEQLKQDPDADALLGLMTAWQRAFGATPTTVRRAAKKAEDGDLDLQDAIQEFPVWERGGINRSKLGWIMKRNANRIVGNLEIQKATADGRPAWQVVTVEAPPSPPLPPSGGPGSRTSYDEADSLESLSL